MSNPSFWTDELKQETLKFYVIDGLSPTVIATRLGKKLGRNVTRGQVIGIIHRNGGYRPDPKRGVERGVDERNTQSILAGAAAAAAQRIVAAKERDAVSKILGKVPAPIKRSPPGVALIDLKLGDCRFPLTAHPPGECHRMRFCGASAHGAYCSEHAAIAWRQRSTVPVDPVDRFDRKILSA